MITLDKRPVDVLAADDGLATVLDHSTGRVQCVAVGKLHGTEGGCLEVARVVKAAELKSKALERARPGGSRLTGGAQ